MNKTLTETIKGLKLCISNEDICNECSYQEYNTEGMMEESCIQKLMEDALESLEEKQKTKKPNLLNEFIQFAKDKYDIEIIVKPSDNPDTFEKIFGGSFLKGESKE